MLKESQLIEYRIFCARFKYYLLVANRIMVGAQKINQRLKPALDALVPFVPRSFKLQVRRPDMYKGAIDAITENHKYLAIFDRTYPLGKEMSQDFQECLQESRRKGTQVNLQYRNGTFSFTGKLVLHQTKGDLEWIVLDGRE